MSINNNYTTDKVASDMINMMAKQMGAKYIKSDPAYINIYTFELEHEFRIKYMLNLRRGKGMYLHRVAPYPIMLGKFYGETDVVDYMKRDLQKFQNALSSGQFEQFLELTDELTNFNRQIEQLFLNRNVPKAAFKEFAEEMKNVRKTIEQVASESPMIYDTERLMGVLDVDPSDLGPENE